MSKSRQRVDEQTTIEHLEIAGIMQSKNGRNVLRRVLVSCGYFSSTFDENDRKHAYNEGRRSAAINLIQQLQEAAPGELQQLLREHFDG